MEFYQSHLKNIINETLKELIIAFKNYLHLAVFLCLSCPIRIFELLKKIRLFQFKPLSNVKHN